MDVEGKSTLCVVTSLATGSGIGAGASEERQLTLGQLMGKLNHGTGSLQSEYARTHARALA